MRRENTAMQAELLTGSSPFEKLSELSAENTRRAVYLIRLESLMDAWKIAEVIGTDAHPLLYIIVINRGSQNQLKVGQTVLDDKGIMGQIIA